MKDYAPTRHIGHIVITADVDRVLNKGESLTKTNGKIKKQRDTLGLYDATYVIGNDSNDICESPRLRNVKVQTFDTLIIRPFSKFNTEIISRILRCGHVDFFELMNFLQSNHE